MKKVFVLTMFLFVLLVAFFLIARSDYNNNLDQEKIFVSQEIEFEVATGESSKSVINSLLEKGVLSKKQYYYFLVYLKLNDLSSTIQAGKYNINGSYSIKSLLALLQNGKGEQVWITIMEGLRKDEIAQTLADQLKDTKVSFSKEAFLEATNDADFIATLNLENGVSDLEGFLFPDTYLIPADCDEKYIIKLLIDTFKSKVGTITYEELIIASMVEREGNNETDRPIIAGIIKKRLAENWFLNIDATLLYAKKDWKYILTNKDLAENNEYNTYANKGLPPTPICNPSLESINSTIVDKETEYYYYIHGNDGVAYYAKTLTEHNNNITKYLKK